MVTQTAARRLWADRIAHADAPSIEIVGRGLVDGPNGSRIPDPATFSNPDMVTEFRTTRAVRSIVHDVPAAAEPPASLRSAGPRTGRLTYLFTSAEEAARAEHIHTLPGVVQLIDPEIPGRVLWYVAQGRIEVELTEVGEGFVLKVEFHERAVDIDQLVTIEQPLNRDTRLDVTP